MSKLNWINKDHSRQSEKCDVALRLNRNGRTAAGNIKHNVVFRFSANSVKKIVTNTLYAKCAVDEQRGRVYFTESDVINGYKLICPSMNGERRHFQISSSDDDFWAERVGDYNLLFDRDEKLYYLDFSKKLK